MSIFPGAGCNLGQRHHEYENLIQYPKTEITLGIIFLYALMDHSS